MTALNCTAEEIGISHRRCALQPADPSLNSWMCVCNAIRGLLCPYQVGLNCPQKVAPLHVLLHCIDLAHHRTFWTAMAGHIQEVGHLNVFNVNGAGRMHTTLEPMLATVDTDGGIC